MSLSQRLYGAPTNTSQERVSDQPDLTQISPVSEEAVDDFLRSIIDLVDQQQRVKPADERSRSLQTYVLGSGDYDHVPLKGNTDAKLSNTAGSSLNTTSALSLIEDRSPSHKPKRMEEGEIYEPTIHDHYRAALTPIILRNLSLRKAETSPTDDATCQTQHEDTGIGCREKQIAERLTDAVCENFAELNRRVGDELISRRRGSDECNQGIDQSKMPSHGSPAAKKEVEESDQNTDVGRIDQSHAINFGRVTAPAGSSTLIDRLRETDPASRPPPASSNVPVAEPRSASGEPVNAGTDLIHHKHDEDYHPYRINTRKPESPYSHSDPHSDTHNNIDMPRSRRLSSRYSDAGSTSSTSSSWNHNRSYRSRSPARRYPPSSNAEYMRSPQRPQHRRPPNKLWDDDDYQRPYLAPMITAVKRKRDSVDYLPYDEPPFLSSSSRSRSSTPPRALHRLPGRPEYRDGGERRYGNGRSPPREPAAYKLRKVVADERRGRQDQSNTRSDAQRGGEDGRECVTKKPDALDPSRTNIDSTLPPAPGEDHLNEPQSSTKSDMKDDAQVDITPSGESGPVHTSVGSTSLSASCEGQVQNPRTGVSDNEIPLPMITPHSPFDNLALPVPGLWDGQVGLANPAIVQIFFTVDAETSRQLNIPHPDATVPSVSTKPPFRLRLLCTPVDSWNDPSFDLNSVSLAKLKEEIGNIETQWPPKGDLIVEFNKGSPCQKTWMPWNLEPTSPPIDLTEFIREGTNVVRIIQLADMSRYVFVLHASLSTPSDNVDKVDLSCLLSKPDVGPFAIQSSSFSPS